MEEVVLKSILKKYSNDHIVVRNVSLSVQPGELVSLLGPSGCGKTTLLRIIAGLLNPDEGSIWIRNNDVTLLPAYKRDIGMVFQNYALFPHMTVYGNIAFGLKRRKVSNQEIKERVTSALQMVNMLGFADRYAKSLSGGQQQRVALARALVLRPAILLLDEPLSALDAKLRVETRDEIRRLQQELGLSSIFVTHDQEEALVMSDRIAVMNQGVIQQLGSPKEIFERPNNVFVAKFMGVTNVFPATFLDTGLYRTEGGFNVVSSSTTSSVTSVAVRPDRVNIEIPNNLSGVDGVKSNRFQGTVVERTYTGTQVRLIVRIQTGQSIEAAISSRSAAMSLHPGDDAVVSWHPDDTLLLLPEISA